MKRHAMSDLPETDDEVAQWCKDIFMAKDALLDKHLAEGTFGDEHYKPIGRPVKSLLVVLSWACLLLFATFRFFKWSALLSTWKGAAIAALGLLLVTAVMHLFILFSQSERSSPAKVAPSKPKKE